MNNPSDFDVKVLLDTRVRASQLKDIDQLMSLYSPSIVYYDAVPPIQIVGIDDVRLNFVRFFDGYDGPIGLETHDQATAVSGDIAFAHMIYRVTGSREYGQADAMTVRSTVCCRRSGGKWSITHEHVSAPIGPDGSFAD